MKTQNLETLMKSNEVTIHELLNRTVDSIYEMIEVLLKGGSSEETMKRIDLQVKALRLAAEMIEEDRE